MHTHTHTCAPSNIHRHADFIPRWKRFVLTGGHSDSRLALQESWREGGNAEGESLASRVEEDGLGNIEILGNCDRKQRIRTDVGVRVDVWNLSPWLN